MSLIRSLMKRGMSRELMKRFGMSSSSSLESSSSSFKTSCVDVEASFFFEVEASFFLFLGRDSSLDIGMTRET